MLCYLRTIIYKNYLYRTRDYAFIISAMGKLFVTLFAPPRRDFVAGLLNFCFCTQDRFLMVYTPIAPVPATSFVTGDKSWLRSNLYRGTRNVHKTLYPDGKKCAIPSLPAGRQACTVILRSAQDFWLKYQDPARCLRRVTQPTHIAGPLAHLTQIPHRIQYDKL